MYVEAACCCFLIRTLFRNACHKLFLSFTISPPHLRVWLASHTALLRQRPFDTLRSDSTHTHTKQKFLLFRPIFTSSQPFAFVSRNNCAGFCSIRAAGACWHRLQNRETVHPPSPWQVGRQRCTKQVLCRSLDGTYRHLMSFVWLFQDVPRCSKMFQDVPRCSKMFQDVPRCSKMFQDVPSLYSMPKEQFPRSTLLPSHTGGTSSKGLR